MIWSMSSFEKFKFDRCKFSEVKVSFLRVVFILSSFKLKSISRNLTFSSRDVAFFINHDFLNIRLKRLKNDLFKNNLIKKFISELIARDSRYSINQNFLNICLKRLKNDLLAIYSIKTTFVQEKLFIFQQFQINRRSRAAAHCFFHRFSRKFNIFSKTESIEIHVNIMYKRKAQKINFVNVEIIDELKSKTNFKWKKFLKSSITSAFLKQLFDLYEFFLISKFSKIKRDSRLISKCLQKMLFNAELFSQKRDLMIKLLYRRKIALIWNFNKINTVKSKIMKNQKIRIVFHKVWQISDFFVFKTLKSIVIKMLQKRFNAELLKSCFKFYQNSWFLINKKIKNKY